MPASLFGQFTFATVIVLGLFGCVRSPTPEFSSANEVAELPELHQSNIAGGLARLFGTPTNPRVREVDDEAEVSDDEPTPLTDIVDQGHLRYGAQIYNARCAGCHGITGDGNGPAGEFLRPRPRDYRNGIFKFTSTPYGYKPARHDLVRTIRRGAKGTSMPAFPWMSDEDLDAVISYVVFLSQRGEVERYAVMMSEEYDEDEEIEFVDFTDGAESAMDGWSNADGAAVMPVSAEPEYSEATVTAGRRLFLSQGCAQCHGNDGKGQIEWLNPRFLAEQAALPDAEREKINYDAWQEPAPAADLTARMLHGGRRPIDIYRRIYTGINGTPMPAFGSVFANEPEKIWHLVHYVRHIIEGGDPTAGITQLPTTPPTSSSDPVESSSNADEVTAQQQPNDETEPEPPVASEEDEDAADAPENDSDSAEEETGEEETAEQETGASAS